MVKSNLDYHEVSFSKIGKDMTFSFIIFCMTEQSTQVVVLNSCYVQRIVLVLELLLPQRLSEN